MPLKLTKCKTPKDYNLSNHLVAVMQVGIDPNTRQNEAGTTTFGWPSTYWSSAVGTVLLTRADFKAVDVETIEAFASFCRGVLVLIRRTEKYHDEIGPQLTDDQVLAEITAPKWEELLIDWKADKVAALNNLSKRTAGGVDGLIESMSGVTLKRSRNADGVTKTEAVQALDQI